MSHCFLALHLLCVDDFVYTIIVHNLFVFSLLFLTASGSSGEIDYIESCFFLNLQVVFHETVSSIALDPCFMAQNIMLHLPKWVVAQVHKCQVKFSWFFCMRIIKSTDAAPPDGAQNSLPDEILWKQKEKNGRHRNMIGIAMCVPIILFVCVFCFLNTGLWWKYSCSPHCFWNLVSGLICQMFFLYLLPWVKKKYCHKTQKYYFKICFYSKHRVPHSRPPFFL